MSRPNNRDRGGFDWWGNGIRNPESNDRQLYAELQRQRELDRQVLERFANGHTPDPTYRSLGKEAKTHSDVRINEPGSLKPEIKFEGIDLRDRYRTSDNLHSSARTSAEQKVEYEFRTSSDDGRTVAHNVETVDNTTNSSRIHEARGNSNQMSYGGAVTLKSGKQPRYVEISTYAKWVGNNNPTRVCAANTWYNSPVVGATGVVTRGGYAGPVDFMTTGYWANDYFITAASTATASYHAIPAGVYLVTYSFVINYTVASSMEVKVWEEVSPNAPLGPNGAATVHHTHWVVFPAGTYTPVQGSFIMKFPGYQGGPTSAYADHVLGFGIKMGAAGTLSFSGPFSSISIFKLAEG